MATPKRHRNALAELAAGGLLYVYIGNGQYCKSAAIIGSGVIVGGLNDRLLVSVGTVNALLRRWVSWSEREKAHVLLPSMRDTARLLGNGRDVLMLTSPTA